MKKMMEHGQAHLKIAMVKDALRPLRKAYQLEVERIANSLALQFQARRFDGTKPEEEWELFRPGDRTSGQYPFNLLDDFCETLPICQDHDSACMVLAISKYAGKAALYWVENCCVHPGDGRTWSTIAGWCVARDVHDYALARGWARSRRERSDSSWKEPEPRRKAARS
jgi:hypothetical protein